MTWQDNRGLYVQDGQVITTHSMLQAFSRCPKQAQYKYAERLKPRYATKRQKPLRRGTWFHKLLEEHYAGRSWKSAHRQLSREYSELFDEEKEALGDLPTEMAALMRSYLWHYGADKNDPYHGWNVLDTELTLECPWPDGQGVYRCRLDILFEDEFGLWIGDHKTHKTLPGLEFRLLDHASARYIWCARENGLNVRGFVWNYIRAKAPTKPKMAYLGKSNERLSVADIETDYPTFVLALKEYQRLGYKGVSFEEHRDQLKYLKSLRWKHGEVQKSTFFRRDILEKDDNMLARVIAASMRTRDRMNTYDWEDQETIERTVDRSCTFMCDYVNLCTTELFGGNADNIRRQQFRVGDPLDYYQDQKQVD